MAILGLEEQPEGRLKFDLKDTSREYLESELAIQKEVEEKTRIEGLESRPISSFLLSMADSALLSPKIVDKLTFGSLKQTREDLQRTNPLASTLGDLAGYIVPGTIGTKAVRAGLKGATKAGLRAGVKGATRIGSATKSISKTLQSSKPLKFGVEEAIVGAGIGTSQGLIEGDTREELGKRAILEAGLGLVLGAGFGKISDVWSSRFKKPKNIAEEVSERFKFDEERIDKIIDSTAKPITRSADDVRVDIEATRLDAESKINNIKKEMPSGNVRKREINKVKRERNREVERLNRELKNMGEPEIRVEEGRKPTTSRVDVEVPETEVIEQATRKPRPTTVTPETIETPEITRTPEQIEIDKRVEEIRNKYTADRKAVEEGFLSPDVKSKRLKSLGMQESAEIRSIRQGDRLIPVEGGLTTKELNNEIKRLRSNYVGKEVMVDGKVGRINKNVFGDVMVKFDDGTVTRVSKDKITPVQNIDELIATQRQEALSRPTQQTGTGTMAEQVTEGIETKRPTSRKTVEPTETKRPKKVPTETKKPTKKTQEPTEQPKTERKVAPKRKVKLGRMEPKVTKVQNTSTIAEQFQNASKERGYKGKKKESRFRQRTLVESDVTPDNIKKIFNEDKVYYEGAVNKRDFERAADNVAKDFETELNKFRQGTGKIGSSESMRAQALYLKALSDGDTTLANEIATDMTMRATLAGQEIQALSWIKRYDAEGMILHAKKLENRVNTTIEDNVAQQFEKIKPNRNVAQGVFKVEDLIEDAGFLKGFLKDMRKQCPL